MKQRWLLGTAGGLPRLTSCSIKAEAADLELAVRSSARKRGLIFREFPLVPFYWNLSCRWGVHRTKRRHILGVCTPPPRSC
jgi:hypothetical protein